MFFDDGIVLPRILTGLGGATETRYNHPHIRNRTAF
jgi:hypothetical protein